MLETSKERVKLSKAGTDYKTIENLYGLNGGKNGGRICWSIAGTFCGEKIQGFFAKKILSCKSCNFFKTVRREEGIEHFRLTKPNDTHSHIKCTDLDENYVESHLLRIRSNKNCWRDYEN